MIPAVSVILPCYNVTQFIAEALESLRAQTFRDFEIIIVNDGCPDTDNLERALQPYSEEISYVKQENGGPAAARNTGVGAAQAPLIAFLDGDDAWEPDYLESQTAILAAHPEVDVLYTNIVSFGGGASSGRESFDLFPEGTEMTFEKLVRRKCLVPQGATVRRQSLIRVGLFDPGLRSAEDLDLWLRMAKAGARFMHNPKPVYRYRMREGSLSDDRLHLMNKAVCVYQKHLAWGVLSAFEKQALQDAIRETRADMELYLGKAALYARRRDEALQRFRRAREIHRSWKLLVAILALEVCPTLLYSYVHRRYPTEHAYLH